MTDAEPTPQELLVSLRNCTGEARFRFARTNVGVLLARLPKPADLLGHLTDHETFEACFDQPAYSSFLIELTESLVAQYRVDDFRGLRMAIEDCLWTIAKSQRESDQFVDFCTAFGKAIEDFILGVDSNFSNVMLPISNRGLINEKNPGMRELRRIIAKTLVRRCAVDQWREVASMIGTSTGTIGMESLKDFMGEIRSLDDFLFHASLGFYLTWGNVSSEYCIGEISRVEEATRSRVKQRSDPTALPG